MYGISCCCRTAIHFSLFAASIFVQFSCFRCRSISVGEVTPPSPFFLTNISRVQITLASKCPLFQLRGSKHCPPNGNETIKPAKNHQIPKSIQARSHSKTKENFWHGHVYKQAHLSKQNGDCSTVTAVWFWFIMVQKLGNCSDAIILSFICQCHDLDGADGTCYIATIVQDVND